MENLRRQYIIKTKYGDEGRIAEVIYEHLAGNEDYVENRIVLNMSGDRLDETTDEVHVYVFEDSKTKLALVEWLAESEGFDFSSSYELNGKVVIYDLR